MFSFPMDGEWQHPKFRHQQPPHRPIQTGWLSLPEIWALSDSPQLVDICIALQYLHAQDIVHGDLKGVRVFLFFPAEDVLSLFAFG